MLLLTLLRSVNEKLAEVWPAIQHEIDVDPIRIPCVPQGQMSDTFKNYVSIISAEYSQADVDGELYTHLESEWGQLPSQEDDNANSVDGDAVRVSSIWETTATPSV